MHDVQALIAKSNELAVGVRQFESAIVCPLVQGFSLLPITDAPAKEFAVYPLESNVVLAKPIRGPFRRITRPRYQNLPSNTCCLHHYLLFWWAGRARCARLG